MTRLLQIDPGSVIPGVHDGSWTAHGPVQTVRSPIHGQPVGDVSTATAEDLDRVLAAAHQAFLGWRQVPAPVRAEAVRRLGQAFREHQEELAHWITLEVGKTLAESRGEVQEMIDICDLATGLGRQIGGLTLPSERPGHRLIEQWHPLGAIGVITSFNFPMAVWAWNAALALVCGDAVVWKPSSRTPLSAVAVIRLAARVLEEAGHPPGLVGLVVGPGREIGDRLASDRRLPLISYTGSVPIGRRIGRIVQERFGRPLLELGGNAAAIVTPEADLDLAIPAVFFGALGTSGQRCTTTRRVIVHQDRYDELAERLESAYRRVTIGDPREETVLMGPLVSTQAVRTMQDALERIRAEGGRVRCGGEVLDRPGGCYVTPGLVDARREMPILREETFAPILYLIPYRTLEEAVEIQNDVPQGLSSAIFSSKLEEVEQFLGPEGSDCGLANVNTGTSGAEIGGAFGGEKETGGGRESGSDSWKAYMRRQTTVINGSGRLELAQGLRFEV